MASQLPTDRRLVAVQQEAEVLGPPVAGLARKACDDHRRAEVAAHCVDRYHRRIGHGALVGPLEVTAPATASGRYIGAPVMQSLATLASAAQGRRTASPA